MRVRVGSHSVTQDEREAVNAVLDSNQLSPGRQVKRFEDVFAKRHGAEYGVMVNSGTDALRIAVAALKELYKWPKGSKVLVPAVTFVATVNVILQNDLVPVFVDIDPWDYGFDRDRLLEGSNKAARCVMPVHLFGKPSTMSGSIYPFSVKEQAGWYGMRVIEDSCECMGVADLVGDVACYSTYVCHLISTGVGGVAITRRKQVAEVMRSLANHGRSVDHIPGHKTSKDITKRFVFDRIGYSSRPTEIEAALGLEQLKHLDGAIKRRRKIAEMLTEGLDDFGVELSLPVGRAFDESAWMMYPIVVQKWAGFTKWTLCNYLEANGVETREMLPLINQPCYKFLNIDQKQFPNATHVNKNGFYVGCHPGMTDDDVAHVIGVFREFFAKVKNR